MTAVSSLELYNCGLSTVDDDHSFNRLCNSVELVRNRKFIEEQKVMVLSGQRQRIAASCEYRITAKAKALKSNPIMLNVELACIWARFQILREISFILSDGTYFRYYLVKELILGFLEIDETIGLVGESGCGKTTYFRS